MFCNTATMERDMDATTRSMTTARRADVLPPSTGSGRTAATQLAAPGRFAATCHRTRPVPRPSARRRGHDLADEDADRGPRRAEAGPDEDHDRDQADADLDEKVRRQRPVGPVGLQQPAVEGEEDEEAGGSQDRRDADAALLVEQHGHTVPAREHDDRPHEDDHGPLSVHPPPPAPDQVPIAVLVPDGDPTHHGHHHGGPGHREDRDRAPSAGSELRSCVE